MTNAEWYEKELKKLGYRAEKEELIKNCCPPKYENLFTKEPMNCDDILKCDNCKEWWLKEHE